MPETDRQRDKKADKPTSRERGTKYFKKKKFDLDDDHTDRQSDNQTKAVMRNRRQPDRHRDLAVQRKLAYSSRHYDENSSIFSFKIITFCGGREKFMKRKRG